MTSRLSFWSGPAGIAIAALSLGACAAVESAEEGASLDASEVVASNAQDGLDADAVESSFRIVEDPKRLAFDVFEDDQPVLSYYYGDQLPDGVPEDRMRSSYAHPIYGLDAEMLTDDFPADHYHHRGLSLMWPRMKAGEQACELWHIKGIRSLYRSWSSKLIEGGATRFSVSNAWVLDDGREAAKERVTYTVSPATDVGRAIDVRYSITVGEEPITLQGAVTKGYGGLNLRFAPRTDTVITTDQGVAKDSDRARFRWADLSAKFAGREAVSGIAIFVDPGHPAFPPPWTLRHYGDLNVAWPGVEEVVLEPGSNHVLRYRLWVHRGDAEAGQVAEQWSLFEEVARQKARGFGRR